MSHAFATGVSQSASWISRAIAILGWSSVELVPQCRTAQKPQTSGSLPCTFRIVSIALGQKEAFCMGRLYMDRGQLSKSHYKRAPLWSRLSSLRTTTYERSTLNDR